MRPSLKDHFPFIKCLFEDYKRDTRIVAKLCIENTNSTVSFDELIRCANGPLGNQLLYANAFYTDKLIPPRNYVPWIVVDNIHTDTIQEKAEFSLVDFINQEYKVDLN